LTRSICYIVPYFGKLPPNFQLWLNTCETNKTIDWIVITNDRTGYNYPKNVKTYYLEFNEIKRIIQSHYDFDIKIDTYWCLSLFKPAYGEIFSEYLKNYDYWGHCDIDLLWGDIRKFITDDVLNKYERIGFQGHSTIYKNTKEVNTRYRTIVDGKTNYIDVFSGKSKISFDENGMDDIYNYLKIPFFNKTVFAHLSISTYSFWIRYLPQKDDYKNRRQIFTWEKGKLLRYFIDQNEIHTEEYMYIHFFTRPMKYKAKGNEKNKRYVIYPDVVKILNNTITVGFIKRHGKCSKIAFYLKTLYYNRNKISLQRIKKRLKLIKEGKNSTKKG